MEIQATTIRVLEKTVPKWLKKLCTADFDAMNLSHYDRNILATDGECCMLGEMYDDTNAYYRSSMDEFCTICEAFSTRIPENMGIGSYQNDSDDESIDRDYHKEDIVRVLDDFAQHISTQHAEKMQKPIVINDC